MGVTCTMAHEHTPNTPELCRSADLVVSAVGNPGMIKGDWLKPGATIIDIGTRCVKDRSGTCSFHCSLVSGRCFGGRCRYGELHRSRRGNNAGTWWCCSSYNSNADE